MAKHIHQFEKDWVKSIKKIKTKPETKKDKVKPKSISMTPIIEQPKFDPADASLNTIRLDETTEVIQ